jgi:hypothetical protein
MKPLTEGRMKKGGLNNPPSSPRPEPPKAQGKTNIIKYILIVEVSQK